MSKLALREQEIANREWVGKRVAVADCPARIPQKFIEDLEQNQKLPSCCRHPENHDIMAFRGGKSADGEAPVIYVFICKERHEIFPGEFGEAWHRRFCIGGTGINPHTGRKHFLPAWDIR